MSVNDNTWYKLDIGLEVAFQASALGIASVLSVSAFAPALSADVKQDIRQAVGLDADAAHEHLKHHVLMIAERMDQTMMLVTSGRQDQSARPRKPAKDECKGQQIEIGRWIFTLPAPNCL